MPRHKFIIIFSILPSAESLNRRVGGRGRGPPSLPLNAPLYIFVSKVNLFQEPCIIAVTNNFYIPIV